MRRLLGAASIAAMLLAATACSGDEGDDAGTTTTSATAPAGTTPETTAVPLDRGAQVYVYLPEVGDCWEPRRTDESSEGGAGQSIVFLLDCQLPHANETFAIVEVFDETFPGDGALQEFARDECPAHFEDYVGTPYELSELEMGFWAPSQVIWNQTFRHWVACYVYLPNGPKPTGSLRDSGR